MTKKDEKDIEDALHAQLPVPDDFGDMTSKQRDWERSTRYNRVRKVAGLLLMNFREGEIIQLVRKEFKVKAQAVKKDIRAIRERWKIEGGPRVDKLRQDVMGQALVNCHMALVACEKHPHNHYLIDKHRKAAEFLARLLGMDKGATQITLNTTNIVPLTQHDVLPDGSPANIKWAPPEQKRPAAMNRLLGLE